MAQRAGSNAARLQPQQCRPLSPTCASVPYTYSASVSETRPQLCSRLFRTCTHACRCVYFLEERLAPSDTSAARAVLRHIYTEQLTFESPCQLVSILKIADKWKAQDTIDAGRAAFSQLKPEDL